MILFWLEHGPQHHLPCTLKAAVVSYVILCSKHGVTFDEKHKKKTPQKKPKQKTFSWYKGIEIYIHTDFFQFVE